MGFPGGSVVRNPPAKQETRVPPLGWEDLREEEMAKRSSILAWEIPEEPGGLQSMGLQRAGRDWETEHTLNLQICSFLKWTFWEVASCWVLFPIFPCTVPLSTEPKKAYLFPLLNHPLGTACCWCDPIDGSAPGSPIPGILQARTLEWDAISFSNTWK